MFWKQLFKKKKAHEIKKELEELKQDQVLKELKKVQVVVKNDYALKNIPPDKLFISESGYAYDIDEIVKYVKGEGKNYKKEAYLNVMPGLLKDYENRDKTGINTNVFTTHDIEELMDYPPFVEAMETITYQTFHKCVFDIRPETADLIKEAAEMGKGAENNPFVTMNEVLLGNLLGKPVHALYLLFTKNIEDCPPEEQKLLEDERKALVKLTDRSNLTPYDLVRGLNVMQDVKGIVKDGGCSAGFHRQMANLTNLIETYKRYDEALRHKHQLSP